MPIVACKVCGKKIPVPTSYAGRAVRCSECGGNIAPISGAPDSSPPAPLDSDTPLPTKQTDRSRKRKKKEPQQPEFEFAVPNWMWWVGGLGISVGAIVMAGVLPLLAGDMQAVKVTLVFLAIMVPVSVIVFVISMLISNEIAGGIEFGRSEVVLVRVAALLCVVNLVELIPYGGPLSFPIWLLGLTHIFRISPWQGRILVVTNWLVNFVVEVLLASFLLPAVLESHPNDGPGVSQPPTTWRAEPREGPGEATKVQDHAAMTTDQRFKGCLLPADSVALEKFGICEMVRRPVACAKETQALAIRGPARLAGPTLLPPFLQNKSWG